MPQSLSEPQVRKPFLDPYLAVHPAVKRLPRKALFLDRDGVINVDYGYVHKPADTQFIPGIFEWVGHAIQLGFLPVVVTNQAGIARDYYAEQTFLEYTAWMHDVFREHGAPIAATFYCPHHPGAGMGALRVACACRKPMPGMILAAQEMLDIDLQDSILIGDKPSDMEAAVAAGIVDTLLFTEDSFNTRLPMGSCGQFGKGTFTEEEV